MKTLLIILLSVLPHAAYAKVVKYSVDIKESTVNYTGQAVTALTLNGKIPGPVLTFTEGDTAEVTFHNKMDVESSIHWHGILLPNYEDGVPYLTTPPIYPRKSHTYRFDLTHAGTYWYHSHTGLQEQQGVYGAIVIRPRKPRFRVDQEVTLVLSDWTDEDPDQVMANLKKSDHYYALKKDAVQSWDQVIQAGGVGNRLMSAWTRMGPMDISDVGYDAFLVNGQRSLSLDNLKPGQKVLLRVVNASASTYFHLNWAAGDFKVVAADGVDVAPHDTRKILQAIAETYDLLIEVPASGSYEWRATAQDGTGKASVWIGSGKKKAAPDIPRPNPYAVDHSAHGDHADHGAMDHSEMDHSTMDHSTMDHGPTASDPMTYDDLRSPTPTKLSEKRPLREVHLRLTGNMERYEWSFNNKTFAEERYIIVKRGERVRFVLDNETMMHHPIHLHGHFFRVVNRHGDYSPMKHTVDVPPMGQKTIEFAADEDKDWMFHCHILYHMKSGMTRIVRYEGTKMDPRVIKAIQTRKKQPFAHWYTRHRVSAGYPVSSWDLRFFSTRNAAVMSGRANTDEQYEGRLVYERNLSRFLDAYVGGEVHKIDEDEERRQGPVVGIRYMLPMLVETDLSYGNAAGDAFYHASLGTHLQLMKRVVLDWHYGMEWEEHDGELGKGQGEFEAALEYQFSMKFSVRAVYDSQLGTGGDLTFRF